MTRDELVPLIVAMNAAGCADSVIAEVLGESMQRVYGIRRELAEGVHVGRVSKADRIEMTRRANEILNREICSSS